MKADQGKCYFLLSLDISTMLSLPACILENSDSRKLCGVTIDRKFNINEHVTNLCDKASRKIHAPPIYTPNTKTTFNECQFYVSIWVLSFSLDVPQ